MTSATGTTESTQNRDTKKDVVLTQEANEWGQLTGLEPHVTYFVVRKPTPEWTKERSRAFVEDVRAFLHEHRVLTDQQVTEINQRYGEPAKAKAKELRETLEKRFDEIAKELEARFEQVEKEVQTRFGRKNGAGDDAASSGPETGASATTTTTVGAETPGEIPTGEATTPAAGETSADARTKSSKKPAGKKSE